MMQRVQQMRGGDEVYVFKEQQEGQWDWSPGLEPRDGCGHLIEVYPGLQVYT